MSQQKQSLGNQSSALTQTAWSLAALGGVLGYSWLFLSTLITSDIPSFGTRASIFLRLLIPETVYLDWTASGQWPATFTDRIPLWIVAIAWYGLAWWIGLSLLKFLAAKGYCRIDRELRSPIAMALGLSLLSLTTLGIGLAGLLSTRIPIVAAIAAWVVVAMLLSLMASKAKGKSLGDSTKESHEASEAFAGFIESGIENRIRKLLMFACGVFVVHYFISGVMPPLEFDVLEYHLQAPKEFWQQGSITFLPHNIYANMPLGAEMHALAWMTLVSGNDGWWYGALIGKLIISLMVPLTAWLIGASIYVEGKRALSRGMPAERCVGLIGAWGGALVYLSLPGISEVSQFGQIDAVLGLYITATAILWRQWYFELESRGTGNGLEWLVGIFAGSALSIKYPALVFAVLPVLVLWFVFSLRKRQATASVVRGGLILLLGVVITAGPWLIKNALLCGNPVYPLASNLLGGQAIDEQKHDQWQRAHAIPMWKDPASGKEYQYSLHQLSDSLQQLFYKSPILSLMFLPLALIGLVWGPRGSTFWMAVWIAIGLACWWFLSHRLDRFWLPLVPLGCWLVGLALRPMLQIAWGIPLAVYLTLGTCYSLCLFASPPLNDARYLVSLDTLRNDVAGKQFGRVPQEIGWINDNIKPQEKVLFVGEAAVFDVRVPMLYSTCFDSSVWDSVMQQSSSATKQKRLSDLGITHICIHWGEIERYRSPGNYGFRSEITPTQVEQLIKEGLLIDVPMELESENVSLYRVNQEKKE